jgi:hypothetical protein
MLDDLRIDEKIRNTSSFKGTGLETLDYVHEEEDICSLMLDLRFHGCD